MIILSALITDFRNVHHPNLSSCLGVHNLEQGLAILSPIVRGRNLHDHLFSNDKLKVL